MLMVSSILPSASQKENMERKETQRSCYPSCRLRDISEKKLERKEIQRTVLQVIRYRVSLYICPLHKLYLSLRTNIIVPSYFKTTFEKLYLTYTVFT